MTHNTQKQGAVLIQRVEDGHYVASHQTHDWDQLPIHRLPGGMHHMAFSAFASDAFGFRNIETAQHQALVLSWLGPFSYRVVHRLDAVA